MMNFSGTGTALAPNHNMKEIQPNVYEGMTGVKDSDSDTMNGKLLLYQCGYCKAEKVSSSTGRDGHIRIRCSCGGKHGDRNPRMHAKWALVTSTSAENDHTPLSNMHLP